MPKFDVTFYAVVRVTKSLESACQEDAVESALQDLGDTGLQHYLRNGAENAEDVLGALVDEADDEEHSKTRYHSLCGDGALNYLSDERQTRLRAAEAALEQHEHAAQEDVVPPALGVDRTRQVLVHLSPIVSVDPECVDAMNESERKSALGALALECLNLSAGQDGSVPAVFVEGYQTISESALVDQQECELLARGAGYEVKKSVYGGFYFEADGVDASNDFTTAAEAWREAYLNMRDAQPQERAKP